MSCSFSSHGLGAISPANDIAARPLHGVFFARVLAMIFAGHSHLGEDAVTHLLATAMVGLSAALVVCYAAHSLWSSLGKIMFVKTESSHLSSIFRTPCTTIDIPAMFILVAISNCIDAVITRAIIDVDMAYRLFIKPNPVALLLQFSGMISESFGNLAGIVYKQVVVGMDVAYKRCVMLALGLLFGLLEFSDLIVGTLIFLIGLKFEVFDLLGDVVMHTIEVSFFAREYSSPAVMTDAFMDETSSDPETQDNEVEALDLFHASVTTDFTLDDFLADLEDVQDANESLDLPPTTTVPDQTSEVVGVELHQIVDVQPIGEHLKHPNHLGDVTLVTLGTTRDTDDADKPCDHPPVAASESPNQTGDLSVLSVSGDVTLVEDDSEPSVLLPVAARGTLDRKRKITAISKADDNYFSFNLPEGSPAKKRHPTLRASEKAKQFWKPATPFSPIPIMEPPKRRRNRAAKRGTRGLTTARTLSVEDPLVFASLTVEPGQPDCVAAE